MLTGAVPGQLAQVSSIITSAALVLAKSDCPVHCSTYGQPANRWQHRPVLSLGGTVMAFSVTAGVNVERDKGGVVRHLEHLRVPYKPPTGIGPNPQALAGEYVRDVAPLYGIDAEQLADVNKPVGKDLTDEGTLLKFAAEKRVMETIVISFVQTYFGPPIWEAGVSVTMHDQPLRVTSSQSTIHFDVHVQKPDAQAKYLPDHINARVLGELLALGDGAPLPKINRTRLLIYRYDPDQRLDPDTVGEKKPEEGAPPGPAP